MQKEIDRLRKELKKLLNQKTPSSGLSPPLYAVVIWREDGYIDPSVCLRTTFDGAHQCLSHLFSDSQKSGEVVPLVKLEKVDHGGGDIEWYTETKKRRLQGKIDRILGIG